MENQPKPKLIGTYQFKSKTVSGNLCKTYAHVYDNGVTTVNQVVLSKEESILRYAKIYTKFGYSLFVKDFGLKLGSLLTLARITTDILNDNQVKMEDII